MRFQVFCAIQQMLTRAWKNRIPRAINPTIACAPTIPYTSMQSNNQLKVNMITIDIHELPLPHGMSWRKCHMVCLGGNCALTIAHSHWNNPYSIDRTHSHLIFKLI